MITDREIADKRNEVTMLRLQINEHIARSRLDEVEQKSLTDADEYAENIMTGNLRRINTRMHKQIREHCETIGALGATIHELEERDALKTTAIDELQKTIEEMKSKVEPPNLAVMVLLHNLNAKTEALEADLKASHTNNAALGKALEEANTALYNAKNVVEGLEAELSNSKSAIIMKNGVINRREDMIKTLDVAIGTIEAELSARKDDSMVLMQVVEALREWQGDPFNPRHMIERMRHIVEGYLDAPGGPVVTLELPSMGTRVVSKNEETLVIDETKMEAVRMLVGSDMWVLHTDEEAVEDKQQKETIDELTETTRKLKDRLSSMYAANSDQDTTINKLHALLADEKITLAAYRNNPLSDQVADRDNRIEQLIVLNEALRVDMELAHNLSRDHIAGQDRTIDGLEETLKLERVDHTAEVSVITSTLHETIKGLKTELDARNKTIKDFKAIEQKETDRLHAEINYLRADRHEKQDIIDKLRHDSCNLNDKLNETDRLHKIIRVTDEALTELSQLYCDRCDQLEKIDEITKKARSFEGVIDRVSANHTAIDEITKIIQEE